MTHSHGLVALLGSHFRSFQEAGIARKKPSINPSQGSMCGIKFCARESNLVTVGYKNFPDSKIMKNEHLGKFQDTAGEFKSKRTGGNQRSFTGAKCLPDSWLLPRIRRQLLREFRDMMYLGNCPSPDCPLGQVVDVDEMLIGGCERRKRTFDSITV